MRGKRDPQEWIIDDDESFEEWEERMRASDSDSSTKNLETS